MNDLIPFGRCRAEYERPREKTDEEESQGRAELIGISGWVEVTKKNDCSEPKRNCLVQEFFGEVDEHDWPWLDESRLWVPVVV